MADKKRPLLYDVKLEAAFLGGLMLSNASLATITTAVNLRPEHFYEALHGRIFEAARALIEAGKPANPITLNPLLPEQVDAAGMNGQEYLAHLVAEATSLLTLVDYAQAIAKLAECRNLHMAGEMLLDELSTGKAPGEAMAAFYADVDAIRVDQATQKQTIVSIEVSAENFVARVMDIRSGKLEAAIKTGLHDLDKATGGLHAGELVILAGRPGSGKEQPVDTPVLTPSGWRAIGQLRPGDEVMSAQGVPVPVIAVHPQGVKTAYRVNFRDGTSTECGIDHLWCVAPSGGRHRERFEVRSLRKLIDGKICSQKKDITRHGAKWRVPLCAPVQFAPEALPIDPYVLGIFIGDGCLTGRTMLFSNPDMDEDIRGRVAERLGASLTENRSSACPYFRLTGQANVTMRNAIAFLGLNIKSAKRFIPTNYLRGSAEQRIDLLRGLMDTDGCCGDRNRTSFSTKSPDLARDISDLVRGLGGLAIVHRHDRTHHEKGVEFYVNIKTEFCPFLTVRKKARWRPHRPSRYIFSVVPSREVEQVCITVGSDDGLYLTNDYIVTHNSSLVTSLGRQIAKAGHGVALFSLEMPESQTMARFIADEASDDSSFYRGYPIQKIEYEQLVHNRNISDQSAERLQDAKERFRKMPIMIDYSSRLTMGEIGVRCRGIGGVLQARLGTALKLIMIDYVQFVQASARYAGQRVYEVGEISAGCKQLAKDTNAAVILVAQLSRAVEQTDDKRPQLIHLRDSGNLEQDADTVLLLYRNAYYLQADPEFKNSGSAVRQQYEDCANKMEINIAKQRMGPTAWITLQCDMACASVRSLQHRSPMPIPDDARDFDGFKNG